VQESQVSPGKRGCIVEGCDCAELDRDSTNGRAGVVLDTAADCYNLEGDIRRRKLCGT
jgi:hypothetical protein